MRAQAIPRPIDLIIPVYRNEDLTRRCIESIVAHIDELEKLAPRIVLVNDSPDDEGTTALLRRYRQADPRFVLIENDINRGFVKSVNSGLKVALKEGRDALLINSDTETFPDTFTSLLKVARADPQIAFVSPRSNNASICSLPHFYGGTVPNPDQAYRNWESVAHLLPEWHYTPTAIGFYLFIKHEIFANFGLLKEAFGLGYEEENDLILRANKVGYRTAIANHSFAFHAGSASFGLLDLDLSSHQSKNLEKIKDLHPEFIPLVQRYERSAHFRAERMLSELVGLDQRRADVVFELTGLGSNHNGTNEFALGVVANFHRRHSDKFSVSVLCSPEAFRFHGLDKLEGIRRDNEGKVNKYAIAIKLGQPFDLHHVNLMEDLAPIGIYAMLDTIAEDCGYLSVSQSLDTLWRHVASHANGIVYISSFSAGMFTTRFPEALHVPSLSSLLPTRLASYPAQISGDEGRHVLILGNHFAHKASVETARILSARFPRLQFVALGVEDAEVNNLRSYRSGTVASDVIEALFSRASVVVLPSYVEGFGFGLMHALARGKVVLARRIGATEEILNTFKSSSGIYLYHDVEELIDLIATVKDRRSFVDDSEARGWEEWVDDLAGFCSSLLGRPDVFTRCSDRLRQTDLLRRAFAWDASSHGRDGAQTNPQQPTPVAPAELDPVSSASLQELLEADGSRFIELAYRALLNRAPDTAGETHYFSRLVGGTAKMQVLMEIFDSEEAKKANRSIPGLHEAVEAHRRRSRTALRGLLSRLRRVGTA